MCFIYLFLNFILYWALADEQCCDSFRWAVKALSHRMHGSVLPQTPRPSRWPYSIETVPGAVTGGPCRSSIYIQQCVHVQIHISFYLALCAFTLKWKSLLQDVCPICLVAVSPWSSLERQGNWKEWFWREDGAHWDQSESKREMFWLFKSSLKTVCGKLKRVFSYCNLNCMFGAMWKFGLGETPFL